MNRARLRFIDASGIKGAKLSRHSAAARNLRRFALLSELTAFAILSLLSPSYAQMILASPVAQPAPVIPTFHGLLSKLQNSHASELKAIDSAPNWLNTSPLTADSLRGKVVLVQFWTYSCINWMRTLPYVRAWAQNYRDKGLVVIGVHTPEFSFEHNPENVRWATKSYDVSYPIVTDDQYKIWNAFGNLYWPALYLFDAQGSLRYQHFGEGAFDQTDMMIRRLLQDAGNVRADEPVRDVNGRGVEAAADWASLRSPENYVGRARTQNFASRLQSAPAEPDRYVAPRELRLNAWGLEGRWTLREESAVSNAEGGLIRYRFHARDLNAVLGPANAGKPVKFKVRLSGDIPGRSAGSDVDENGNGTIVEQRLYQLIRQTNTVDDGTFEIEFMEPGAEAFSFTFG